jgi:hypothetical protein
VSSPVTLSLIISLPLAPVARAPLTRVAPLPCPLARPSNYYAEMVSTGAEIGEFRCLRAKGVQMLASSTEANAKLLMETTSAISSQMSPFDEYEYHRDAMDAVKQFKNVSAFYPCYIYLSTHSTHFTHSSHSNPPPTVRPIHSCIRPRTPTFNSLPPSPLL